VICEKLFKILVCSDCNNFIITTYCKNTYKELLKYNNIYDVGIIVDTIKEYNIINLIKTDIIVINKNLSYLIPSIHNLYKYIIVYTLYDNNEAFISQSSLPISDYDSDTNVSDIANYAPSESSSSIDCFIGKKINKFDKSNKCDVTDITMNYYCKYNNVIIVVDNYPLVKQHIQEHIKTHLFC
jgi:hypothetical protein